MKEKHVPSEIAGEILKHLPVKSLARFKCVSKLWIPLITAIIDVQLGEEIDQFRRRLEEINVNVLRLCDEAQKQVLLNIGNAREVLLACRDRVEVELDDVLALMAFRGDIHRYHEPGDVDLVRNAADKFVRTTIEGIDQWIAEAEALQQEEEEDEEAA